MNDYIDFHPDKILLSSQLVFYTTNSTLDNFVSEDVTILELISQLSKSRNFLLFKRKGENADCNFALIFNHYVFQCFFNGNQIGIKSVKRSSYLFENSAFKYGKLFSIAERQICAIKIENKSRNIRKVYINGLVSSDVERYRNESCSNAMNEIQNNLKFIEETEEEQISLNARNILEMAEQYSILANDIEMEKVQTSPRLLFNNIIPCDYERKDRVAYGFIVDEFEEVYKIGAQVQIENYDKIIAGEIVNIHKESKIIDVLFNKEISVMDIPKSGFIDLSFSNINMEVQLEANSKLMNQNAVNKFFTKVIGENECSGFDDFSLTELDDEFKRRKYPPNDSQIDAIKKGINTKDIFLVMGPPGTGKTTVILEWINYFVKKQGKRVLISSQNNKAVDNVLERFITDKSINCIRIGSEAKVQKNVASLLFENKLTETRKNIIEDTSKVLSVLNEDIINLNNKLFFLEELRPNILKISKLKDNVKNILFSLQNEYITIKEARFNNVNLNQKIKKEEIKIDNLKRNYNKMENYTNFILKHIFLIPLNIVKWMMGKKIKKTNELISSYNTNIEVFNEDVKQFLHKLKDIYEGISFNDFYTEYINNLTLIKNRYSEYSIHISDLTELTNVNLSEDDLIDFEKFEKNLKFTKSNTEICRKLIIIIEEWKDKVFRNQNYFLSNFILESVDVVGATCIGINSQKRFSGVHFDVSIIDEAGQIQIHNALVPISVSNKLIMLGDHMQIPPILDEDMKNACEVNEIDTEYLEKSLFEKLYVAIPDSNKIMLDTQYRMPKEIADIISDWFYGGEYYSPTFKENNEGLLKDISLKPLIIIDTSNEKKRFETKVENAGSYNELEASIVADLLAILDRDKTIEYDQVGIISAYVSQVKMIKSKLLNNYQKDIINSMVATLDSFQGQERDVIIYSFTKSSTILPSFRRIGFLNELRRLNVAMSRCKKTLILIGDMAFLSSCEHQKVNEEGRYVYKYSEKEFSDFIRKIVQDVNEKGRGDMLTYENIKMNLGRGIGNE